MVEVFVNDIRNALKNRSWFSALALSLVLPDMCGMIEYPDMGVAQRYISWYDRFVVPFIKEDDDKSDVPYMSGELAYNLRNTFLHQGVPTINPDKVKEDTNKIDKFVLSLDDDPVYSVILSIDFSGVSYKMMTVDVLNLCKNICDAASQYYRDNHDRFEFDFSIIPHKEVCVYSKTDDKQIKSDPVVDVINKKLKESGKGIQLKGSVLEQLICEDKEKLVKNRVNNSKTLTSFAVSLTANVDKMPEVHKKVEKIKPSSDREEQRFRSFYGRVFSDKKYKEKKIEIIEAVMASETKVELNNRLLKFMPGTDVKEILKRLKPFIKDWPGH